MALKIDESTSIPLFTVLAAIPVLIGFILWLSTIYAIASNAEKINISQDSKIESTKDLLVDIRDRIIRIEESLKK
jgi:hypothetical protein